MTRKTTTQSPKTNKAEPRPSAAPLILIVLVVVLVKRKPRNTVPEENNPLDGKSEFGDQLKIMMKEQQRFRDKDLRLADLASELGTNTTYLSTYLNKELNTTFPTFVIGYRIRYAQELMRNHPTMRLSQVAEQSGFTNEKTFLRSFKAVCCQTPSEWKQGHTPQRED